MKHLLFILISAFLVFSCSHKEKHDTSENWTALDDFHRVMAKAYHPLKDSGTVAPVKKLINELAASADKLLTEPRPEKVDNADVKADLEKLKSDAHVLATEIGNGAADDLIKEKLTALHGQFHKIMEAWHSDEGHEN